mgnify:CR=1 FL=1|tara:strand:- start:402 stop:911 length:510 start_codon:yes stop_codon:yes gene_type:complete
MKKLALVLISLVAFNVNAMMCEREELEHLYNKADVIFEARVISREFIDGPLNSICWTKRQGEECGSKVVTLETGNTYKGALNKQVKVYSIDACYCLGKYFPLNESYLVFAKKSDSSQYEYKDLGACATESLSQAAQSEVLEILSKLKAANKNGHNRPTGWTSASPSPMP